MLPTVLFVAGDLAVLESYTLLTQAEPYEVRTACSAREGLEALAGGRIDVVVAEERLSGVSSSDFLSRACAKFPRVVRVMLTGDAGLLFAARAMRDGTIYRFLKEPVDADELRRTIRRGINMKQVAERGESVRPGMFKSWSSG